MPEDITTRTVTAGSGMPVFQAFPSSPGSYPTFIVLHERYGLVEHTTDLASRVAALGFAVLAPSLYFTFPDQQGLREATASTRVTDAAALEMLDEALAIAPEIPGADPSRLGVFGACATGRYPVLWGANRHLDVCVVLHGLYRVREWTFDPEFHSEEMPTLVARLDAAFLGQFGELDNLVSVDDVRFIRDRFEEANRSYQITLYRGAPHGWMNSTMPGRFRAEITEASFSELAGFLETHLRRPDPRGGEVSWRFALSKSADYDYSTLTRQA